MSACCSAYPCAAGTQFGPDRADADLARYQRRGPDGTTRALREALRAVMPAYASVLDVGAGVGALTCELLAGTSATATIVEASSAYLDAARRAVERLGIADRVRFLHGDFVELAGAVAPVDVVTMDRVVCCYPAFAPLLEAAAARAARGVALSYPRNRWFVRAVMAVQNRFREWRHSPFRTFAHPPAAIHALLAERGFRLRRARPMLVWTVEVWERAGSA